MSATRSRSSTEEPEVSLEDVKSSDLDEQNEDESENNENTTSTTTEMEVEESEHNNDANDSDGDMSNESITSETDQHLSSLSDRMGNAIKKLRLKDWDVLSNEIKAMLKKADQSMVKFSVDESKQLRANLLNIMNRSVKLNKVFQEMMETINLKLNESVALMTEMKTLNERANVYLTIQNANLEITIKERKDFEEEYEDMEAKSHLFGETNIGVNFKPNTDDLFVTLFKERFETIEENDTVIDTKNKILDQLLKDCVNKEKITEQKHDKSIEEMEALTLEAESNIEMCFNRQQEIKIEIESFQLTIDLLANY